MPGSRFDDANAARFPSTQVRRLSRPSNLADHHAGLSFRPGNPGLYCFCL